MHMTFHESYGTLPKDTLFLILRYNVSPDDFDFMLDELGALSADWSCVNDYIISNSKTGMYRPRYF